MKKIFVTLLLAGSLGASAFGVTVSLDSLLVPGASIQIGDKVFDHFSWTSQNIASSAWTLMTIDEENYGFTLQGGNATQVGPGGLDALLGFRVSVIGDRKISDIHGFVNSNGTGPNWAGTVSEIVSATEHGPALASIFYGANSQDPTGFLSQMELVVPPQQELWVSKDINLFVGARGTQVSISQITQRFSQTGVPDGGLTLGLLGFALMGVEALRRKLS